MERRLEYFEDMLDTTPRGREVLSVIERHAKEVLGLVNYTRPVMLAWNRNKGPAFIKSFMDSGFEDDLPFARRIGEVTLKQLLLAMAECLMDFGSPELKGSIGNYAPWIFRTAETSRSLKAIIDSITLHSINV
jgi:hypothetical protein